MKTKSFLLLAAFAAFASAAFAAPEPLDTPTVVLPEYIVSAPRFTPAQKKINTSLAEFRQQAAATPEITVELPAIHAQVGQNAKVALKPDDVAGIRVAKL